MSKRRAVYGKDQNILTVEIKNIEFNDEQIALLKTICNDSVFSQRVKRIAELYVAEVRSNALLTSAADDIATIADFETSVKELYDKLDGLPSRIEAYLHAKKFEIDQLRSLKGSLWHLYCSIQLAKPTMIKPKTNVKSAGPERAAAARLRSLFQEYDVPFVHSVPVQSIMSKKKIWAAGECIKMVFKAGDNVVGDAAISGYIKDAKKTVSGKN